jgi:transaldolase
MARALASRIGAANLLVKIPGTAAGVPAIQTMIGEGISINVTLLFSISSYEAVAEAYLAGLESAAGAGRDLAPIRSVASVFVSRIDAEVDRRLGEIGTPAALALQGKAAVANAQLAYARFQELFAGPRWDALAAQGALVQRPLWASTSTKNPAFPDTLYVDTLIGPDTVNTLPDATIEAFIDHGTVARTIDADVDGARQVVDRLAEQGIDLEEVGRVLEDEGVAAFSKSFGELLGTLEAKADDLT